MNRERRYREQLAIWRELSAQERAEVREHAANCPECARRLAAYQEQDALLCALPDPIARARFRDLGCHVVPGRQRRAVRAFVPALTLLLLLALGFGAASASADALPGDPLYPVKLHLEAGRRLLTVDPEDQRALDARYAERRRTEAEALVALGRNAEMEIAGTLAGIADDRWMIGGLLVTVPAELCQGQNPAPGEWVQMHVRIVGGEIRALTVGLRPETPSAAPPVPSAAPLDRGSPAPTQPPEGAGGERGDALMPTTPTEHVVSPIPSGTGLATATAPVAPVPEGTGLPAERTGRAPDEGRPHASRTPSAGSTSAQSGHRP